MRSSMLGLLAADNGVMPSCRNFKCEGAKRAGIRSGEVADLEQDECRAS